jgi:hypothetical protein
MTFLQEALSKTHQGELQQAAANRRRAGDLRRAARTCDEVPRVALRLLAGSCQPSPGSRSGITQNSLPSGSAITIHAVSA